MQNIDYKLAYDYLQANGEIMLKTLGGKKEIQFDCFDQKIRITNSKGNHLAIDEAFFTRVYNRLCQLDLNDRNKACYYTSSTWKKDNPNTVFAPYLVSLIFYLITKVNQGKSQREAFLNKFHFTKIGHFVLGKDSKPSRVLLPEIKISERLNLVYAFFINERCMYIGKSIQGFSRPANYHKNKVMKSANTGILNALSQNQTVDIYVRSRKVSIEYEGLLLNIIEPIEQALISLYNPEWNNLIQ